MSIASAKMPAVLVSSIICLMLGVAGGIILGSFVETGLNKPVAGGESAEAKDGAAKGGMGGMGMGMPGGGGKAGGMPGAKGGAPGGGKGGGKGFTPSPKTQLSQLVGKLDTLTKKPLAVELTADQKKQLQDLLADLDAKDAISDDEAKAKLEAALKLLEGQKETLEAAGYRWPGTAFAPPADPPANPFKEGDPAANLKSLRGVLGK